MTCEDFEYRLSAYIDRELEETARAEMEQHLRECSACRSQHARQVALSMALREQLPTFKTPDLLQARIQRALRTADTESPATRRWRWTAIAAAALLVITGGYGIFGTRGASSGDMIAQELLSSHVRSLMPNHLTDVASSDQHNVKPWFNGRLDYSPPVYDFTQQGFPLIGGRLDYIGNRPVAALVYQRRKHVINLFLWPNDQSTRRARDETRQGYHLLHWTRNGMTYWATSDLSSVELREFAKLEQQADSLATVPEETR